MKSTGIVRKVDDLGRFVIPKETRRVLDIREKTPLEMFVDGDKIVLRKYTIGCVFCGETHDLLFNKRGKVCRECYRGLR